MSWPTLDPHTQTFVVKNGSEDAIAATLDNLLAAIRDGRCDHVGSLLAAAPALVSATNEDRQTPLHFAAEVGCVGAVRLLIERGAARGAVDTDGQTSLHVAVANEHLECVHQLTRAPCKELVITDNFRMTPLHIAAENGEAPMVQLLIARGAMVDEARPSQRDLLATTATTPKTAAAASISKAPAEPSSVQEPSSPASVAFAGGDEMHRGFAAPSSPEFSRKALLQKSQKDSGGTALFLALQHEHSDAADLIRRAADGEAFGVPACLAHLGK